MTRAARVLDGGAGGALGFFIANTLADGLPSWGGWAVILLVALSGLTLLTGGRMWDVLWAGAGALSQDVGRNSAGDTAGRTTQGPLQAAEPWQERR